MANVKISELAAATTLAATDQFEVNASGTSKSATAQKIADFIASVSQTLTNKTFDTAGAGNSFKINGTAISAVTGSGSVVLSASPTLTGTVAAAAANFSGAVSSGVLTVNGADNVNSLYVRATNTAKFFVVNPEVSANTALIGYWTGAAFGTTQLTGAVNITGALTYAGVALSNSVTGTGSMVLSTSPTLTGLATIGNTGVAADYGVRATNSYMPIGFDMVVSAGGAGGYLWVRDNSFLSLGTNNTERVRVTAAGGTQLLGALTYGGVTLSNSVTGTGAMVLGTSPNFSTSLSVSNGTGFVSLNAGTANGAGYVAWFRPDSTTRIGYMGWNASGANNLNLTLENSAFFSILGGSVGIGVNPSFLLDVYNASTAADYYISRYVSDANASGISKTHVRLEKGAGYGGTVAGYISQGVGSGLVFSTLNGGSLSNLMWLTNAGNVGIGTGTPSVKLDVQETSQSTGYAVLTEVLKYNTASTFTRIYTGQISTNAMFLEVADQANTKGKLSLQPYGGEVHIASQLTYGGVTLSNSVTGTGSMVLSGTPTFTGTATFNNTAYGFPVFVTKGASGGGIRVQTTGGNNAELQMYDTTAGGFGFYADGAASGKFNLFGVNTNGTYVSTWLSVNSAAATFSGKLSAYNYVIGAEGTGDAGTFGFINGNGPSFVVWGNTSGGAGIAQIYAGGASRVNVSSTLFSMFVPLNYGGVTLANSVTGTGSMVLSASPTISGTLTLSGNALSFALSNFSVGVSGSNPFVNWDANDFIIFDRGANNHQLFVGGSEILRVGASAVTVLSGAALKLGNAYVAGAPTATGYVTIQDSNGNTYKVLVGT